MHFFGLLDLCLIRHALWPATFSLGGVVAVVVAAVDMELSKATVVMGFLSKSLSLVIVDIGKILPPSRTAARC